MADSSHLNTSRSGYQNQECQMILNDIPTALLVLKDNRIMFANTSAVSLFKARQPEELKGLFLSDISPPAQPDGSSSAGMIQTLLHSVQPGKNTRFEWVFTRFDRSEISGKVTIRQSEYSDSPYLIFTIVDNTAEHHAINDILTLAEEMKKGNLRARLSSEEYKGDMYKLMTGINAMLDSILHPFRDMNKVLQKIAKGDMSAGIIQEYSGEHEKIRQAVNGVADITKKVHEEISRMVDAAKRGDLANRGNPDLFPGEFAETIKGINEMLDAILTPIRAGNRILQKIRKGDLSERVSIECVGDHAKIKDAINAVHDWLNGLIIYVTRIADGDMTADIMQASDRDQMHGPLIRMRDNIRNVIADVDMLVTSGSEGNLTVRADPSRHKGDFRAIIEGINKTLDSVIVPVHEAMEVSNGYAAYDFTRRMNTNIRYTGEWKAFQQALDDVGHHVSDAIAIITKQIEVLNQATTQASSSIKDISSGSSLLAEIAQNVSLKAEQGGEGLSQILRAMEDLAVNVSDVSARTGEVNQISSDTNTLSKKGSALAREAEQGMKEITSSTDMVTGLVHEIMEEMEKISKISLVISDIASQTNLLALNAAIEAARAGEAGRGFAVVASEVKSLALESRQSAENISEMIEGLTKKTQAASDTMDKSVQVVREGGRALNETLEVFNKIIDSVNTISLQMDNVAKAAEQQAAAVEEITASINEVNTLVSGTAKDAVAAAAASEEAAAAIDQISEQITQVHSAAEKLNAETGKFTV
ncbi:methyl-accepting chemotaxis protein [Methanospirillum sp.]|uniref:methyl-accepting chemotaxis protein n=1 Tax=Methanospirillum sp. TaxID=45200 RepID=UPI002B822A41|nr:methyl-accepting chemotaxis protein [Methanospirillum sp.]HPP77902.1 methyl-accepting chemotaxis protein [Methanospirillum sp.]